MSSESLKYLLVIIITTTIIVKIKNN